MNQSGFKNSPARLNTARETLARSSSTSTKAFEPIKLKTLQEARLIKKGINPDPVEIPQNVPQTSYNKSLESSSETFKITKQSLLLNKFKDRIKKNLSTDCQELKNSFTINKFNFKPEIFFKNTKNQEKITIKTTKNSSTKETNNNIQKLKLFSKQIETFKVKKQESSIKIDKKPTKILDFINESPRSKKLTKERAKDLVKRLHHAGSRKFSS
jgi:hypothetical protein